MKGDAKVIDYLNHQLRHELTAVNQYWLHFRLLEDWGYGKLAKKERKKWIEEMQHAGQAGEPHRLPRGLPQHAAAQPAAHRAERQGGARGRPRGRVRDARRLYAEDSREVCRVANDFVSMDLFENLLRDEESHINFLETSFACSAISGRSAIASSRPRGRGRGSRRRA